MIDISLVVSFNITQLIAVIDHQAQGLAHTFFGGVAQPIDPFEPCSIPKVEARHGIERPA